VYALWRWVFPRLHAQTLLAQIALQALVSLVIFALLSALGTELIAYLRGSPSLFGPPGGVERHYTVTAEERQMVVRLYALIPVGPAVGGHAHAVGTGDDGYRRDDGSGARIDHAHGIVFEVADISLRRGTGTTGSQHKRHCGEQQPGQRGSNQAMHVNLLSCG
jgi:hypothetical protein